MWPWRLKLQQKITVSHRSRKRVGLLHKVDRVYVMIDKLWSRRILNTHKTDNTWCYNPTKLPLFIIIRIQISTQINWQRWIAFLSARNNSVCRKYFQLYVCNTKLYLLWYTQLTAMQRNWRFWQRLKANGPENVERSNIFCFWTSLVVPSHCA